MQRESVNEFLMRHMGDEVRDFRAQIRRAVESDDATLAFMQTVGHRITVGTARMRLRAFNRGFLAGSAATAAVLWWAVL